MTSTPIQLDYRLISPGLIEIRLVSAQLFDIGAATLTFSIADALTGTSAAIAKIDVAQGFTSATNSNEFTKGSAKIALINNSSSSKPSVNLLLAAVQITSHESYAIKTVPIVENDFVDFNGFSFVPSSKSELTIPLAPDNGGTVDSGNSINNGNGTAGSITGNGAFQEGVTLSAPSVTGDPDGDASNPNYSYQWYRDNALISGATNSSYIVPITGSGTYKVAVTYTDAQGFRSAVNSSEQVVSAFNNGNGSPAAITGNGAFQEGVTLTAPVVTGDPDGDAANPNYSYQWFRNSTLISGATNSSYIVPITGSGTYKVAVTYTDAQGFTAMLNSQEQTVTTSNSPTYTITAPSEITEGAILTTSVTTTNVRSGTKLYYSLSGEGINTTDFSKGSLTGFGTVAAKGKFSFLHTIKSDQSTEGDENLEIKLFSDAARTQQVGSTATVVIRDTSPTPIASYTITPSASTINEGTILTTSVTTTNVRSGTRLYYSLSGTGINTTDFSKGSLTGVGTVAAKGKFSFLHTIKSDQSTEGDERLEIKLFSDAARTQQVGSTATVVIRDTSTAPAFRNIGSLALRAGTKGKDRITGLGGEVVFTGANNDILTGFSKMSNDGNWRVPSLLSGGLGNDQYIISQGSFAVIADAGGGTDIVSAPSININNVEFIRVNQRDIYATDGNTSALLIDPQGLEDSANKLENFVLGGKRYTLAQLTKLALNSDSFGGDYTYQQLQSNGWLNPQEAGLNLLSINTYISDSIYNNSIVV